MKHNSILMLACSLVLAVTLTACKGQTPAPAESEPKAAAPAEGESQAAASPNEAVALRRDVQKTPVEVDTSAPPNVGTVPKDAVRSESGLAWVVLKPGAGEARPTDAAVVVMNFIGWTADGKLVDESLSSGRPAAAPVGSLFPGWAEGVQLMVEGEKRRFWIPGELAFDAAKPNEPPAEKEPPRGMLVYDVELLSFETPAP
jgi:FKBP-type peptidyl-prolyl cis-trans isomerase